MVIQRLPYRLANLQPLWLQCLNQRASKCSFYNLWLWFLCDGFWSPLTDWADPGRWSSNAGGGDAMLHGAGMAQLGGGSSSRDLWGSWGGVGWLALGCLRLGRQVQWLCTLTVLQKPKQHSFACCDHRRNLEAWASQGDCSPLRF